MDGCDLPGCDLPDLPGCDLPDMPDLHLHGCECASFPMVAGSIATESSTSCLHPTTMLLIIMASFVVYLLSLGLDETDKTSETLRMIIAAIGCMGVGGFLVACMMGHKRNHDRRNRK